MSSSSPEFCQADEGLDYVFARLSAIYGATFTRHWEGVDPDLVRATWTDICGKFLTYRPSMDYALEHLDSAFPPSALAFRDLCRRGPPIPVPGQARVGFDAKPNPEARRRGLQALRQLQTKLASKWAS